jgi:hypothetical protein
MCVQKIDNFVSPGDPPTAVLNPIIAEHHEGSGEVSIPDKTMPLSAEYVPEELLPETRNIRSQAHKHGRGRLCHIYHCEGTKAYGFNRI